jgi:hypothetical protein
MSAGESLYFFMEIPDACKLLASDKETFNKKKKKTYRESNILRSEVWFSIQAEKIVTLFPGEPAAYSIK